jgi:hypothetical protein
VSWKCFNTRDEVVADADVATYTIQRLEWEGPGWYWCSPFRKASRSGDIKGLDIYSAKKRRREIKETMEQAAKDLAAARHYEEISEVYDEANCLFGPGWRTG